MQTRRGADENVAVQEVGVGQAETRELPGEVVARGQGNNGEGEVMPLVPIRFLGQENKFSNFYPCSVEVYGHEFSSSDVAYQWRKAVFMGEAGVAAVIRLIYAGGARGEMGSVESVWEKRVVSGDRGN